MMSAKGSVAGGPLLLLRLEGAALAIAASILFARLGGSWWLFAALILVPDLSIVGYLAGARIGAGIYNAAHTTLAAIALGVAAFDLTRPTILAISLIWLAHIGADRALGFGLKYRTGFGFTHLGQIGRSSEQS
jgi:predicted membrane-bound dolichyl-phosphate-mannose-protein mannosyltransferase